MTGLPDFMLQPIPAAGLPVPANEEEDAVEGDFIAAGDAAPPLPPPPFQVGVYDAMPAETYHRIEAMSSSGSKKMRRSPAHYKLMRTKNSTPTEAMQLGTAIHTAVLEPHLFDGTVCCAPKCDRRTKQGKADYEAFIAAAVGKVVLSPAAFDVARRCADAVRAHPAAKALLDGAEVEKSFFWEDARYKVPCKARWDARNHGFAIDLKSCQDASADAFARQIASYEYHAQAAHYCSAAEHLLDASPNAFIFIAVETEAPFGVGVYQLPGAAIAAGAHLMNLALARYQEALASGTYPCYPDTIEAITLPRWALRFD